eukprot:CAMPEP_0178769234 /NCGR_PEP_ID=MMETSP0744-20121128/20707_1 /TAXON_ID=913974 /ORGANISM="Nitzschia punctata, Strain CCMP561" /LENGTH=465 /DNA_ID=CAMNT_0020425445 /DNA_START=49 /DNA_END=1446 /DNA_ORIENTATION=-
METEKPPRKRQKGVFRFLFQRGSKTQGNHDKSQNGEKTSTSPLTETTTIVTVDPKRCTCQYIWQFLGRSTNLVGSHESDTPNEQNRQDESNTSSTTIRSKEDFPTAFTPDVLPLTSEQESMLQRLAEESIESIPNLQMRALQVPWGGKHPSTLSDSDNDHNTHNRQWWAPAKTKHTHKKKKETTTPLERHDGGNLLYSYLRIMKWPSNLMAHFPFKLCKKKKGGGCKSTVAIEHTLQFREVYQPWIVTPEMKRINANGAVYQHGFSPSLVDDDDDDGDNDDNNNNKNASHAIVWLRPALRASGDEIMYIRTVVRELERAVALSMERSEGRVGKFNVVVDGNDFSFGVMPSLKGIKAFVTILQDHYVDRLGVVILTSMGRFCEILLKLFLPLITEEVRNKIVILSHDPVERKATLETILGKKNIATWLGGTDVYKFNVDEYYDTDDTIFGTDEEAREYLVTMPYHA